MGARSLLYPWGHHAAIAGMVRLLNISPSLAFCIVNLLNILLLMFLTFQVAKLLSSDRVAAIFSVVLSVFGLTIFNAGPIARIFEDIVFSITGMGRIGGEFRALLSPKLSNINSMPLGVTCFALFLFSIVQIYAKNNATKQNYVLLLIAAVGAGFLYPIVWLALIACFGTISAILLFRRRRNFLAVLIPAAAVIAISILIVLPYIYQIGSSKQTSALFLEPDIKFFAIKCIRYALTLLPIAIVAALNRKALWDVIKTDSEPLSIVAIAAVTSGIMYLFSSLGSTGAEYKYFIVSCFTFGSIAGIPLAQLYRNHRILATIAIALFLVPISQDWIGKLDARNWQVREPYMLQGSVLQHGDPMQEELFAWIRERTERDALFIDSELTIPTFGQRQLYVALNSGWQPYQIDKMRDGWSSPPSLLIFQEGHPKAVVNRRKQIAEALLAGENLVENYREVLNSLDRTHQSNRTVYLVSRQESTLRNTNQYSIYEEVFSNPRATIYRLTDRLPEGETLPNAELDDRL
ncbi:hypothetical protein [Synechococcus sp. PCC 7336]|uniref:hypothetical protein n=1 Tax=Synechococcus sp. PCC 7336 TaxID=195250 RepID=UPI0012E9F0A1|nr:hypothetical protein [Synechococcus sp. PCC 7336]